MVKVTVSGVTKEYETGITYGEVSKDFKDNCKYDIILAKQGAKLIELNKKIKTDCEIEFLDISDPNGHKTYVRGVNLLLLDAFYEVCKDMPLKNVFIKSDGLRIHHIRTSARSGCRMDQEPQSDRYGLLGLQTDGQDNRPFSR